MGLYVLLQGFGPRCKSSHSSSGFPRPKSLSLEFALYSTFPPNIPSLSFWGILFFGRWPTAAAPSRSLMTWYLWFFAASPRRWEVHKKTSKECHKAPFSVLFFSIFTCPFWGCYLKGLWFIFLFDFHLFCDDTRLQSGIHWICPFSLEAEIIRGILLLFQMRRSATRLNSLSFSFWYLHAHSGVVTWKGCGLFFFWIYLLMTLHSKAASIGYVYFH